jgi:hypothetical protein
MNATLPAALRSARVRRLCNDPIIRPHMDDRMGDNINGPSLIKAPSWVKHPLGTYYLYFAHHNGAYIRLACANNVEGPWKTHREGVLPLSVSGYAGHVASPDVHVDEEREEVRMYFHGSDTETAGGGMQTTRVALSTDGLSFKTVGEPLGPAYFRVFRWDGWWYALVMPGQFYRSRDGLSGFEPGPKLFNPSMRHSALKLDGDVLSVYYSNIGDCPERLVMSTVHLAGSWEHWKSSEPVEILEPEFPFEGSDLPNVPSRLGRARTPVRQLRDPCIFRNEGTTYLLYSVAGEYGIGLSELLESEHS